MVDRSILPTVPLDWDPSETKASGLNIRTWSYFYLSDVISAAQKAVRRGNEEEAVQWFLEAFWAGNKAPRTNIWNRALVMAVEDIGPGDPVLITRLIALVNEAKNDPRAIALAAVLLARAKKCRINDWAVHLVHELNNEDVSNVTIDSVGGLEGARRALIEALRIKDLGACLYWTKVLYFTTYKLPKGVYKNAQMIILDCFDNLRTHWTKSLFTDQIRNLALSDNWRWKGNSRLLYAHVVILHCLSKVPTSYEFDIVLPDAYQEVEGLVEKFRRREGLIGIPDYAFDKHTSQGRAMKRGIEHFVKEGAFLSNRDEAWRVKDDQMRELAMKDMKVEIEEKLEEIE